jgi:bisphosphoglycerate-dependent phosphoglycerate mutase
LNQQNRFTGWEDVPLTLKGVEEARRAANLIKRSGIMCHYNHRWSLHIRSEPGNSFALADNGNAESIVVTGGQIMAVK